MDLAKVNFQLVFKIATFVKASCSENQFEVEIDLIHFLRRILYSKIKKN